MGALTSLLAGIASGETTAMVKRARLAAIFYSLAALAGLCGVGFLVGAAYVWFARRYGSVEASLGFGIGFLVVAGLLLLTFRLMGGARRRRSERRRKADMTAIGVSTALALLPALVRGKGGLALLASPIVAFAAYTIYRENSKPDARNPGGRNAGDDK